MFVSLWNYLKGYVIVEVKGHSLEKFMNLCLQAGIEIRDVERKDGCLRIKTSIASFKSLKPHAKKARCRLKIVQKIGLPFLTFRYRKRSVLVFGTLLFATIIYILSSFVWLVEVEGNKRLASGDIITSLEKGGYSTGRLKTKLDLREVEKYLINTYPDIVWTGVKFEGTKMLVQIAEAVPKPILLDEKIPCDIVAKQDGLITYIATDKGMPLVKKGDTVKKGESLVMGTIPLQDEQATPYYMHAKATIKAKTAYRLTGKLSLEKQEKKYTGQVKKKYSLRLFDKKITFYQQKVIPGYWDKVVTIHQLRLTENFPLPFYFEKEEKIEYNPINTRYQEEEAKDKLLTNLWEKLGATLSQDAKVLQREITYAENGNELQGVLEIIAEENIGEQKPIDINPIQTDKTEGVN